MRTLVIQPPMKHTITISVGYKGNLKHMHLSAHRKWTVKEVLEKSGLNTTGYHPRLNGCQVRLSRHVKDGDKVLLLH
ncbi:hypothetical protein GC174_15110 [bacterium]|nr:hypothetical protein [bacterium]